MYGTVSKQCLITAICIYILHRDISSTSKRDPLEGIRYN